MSNKPTRVKGKFKSIFGRKSNGIDAGSVEEKDALELVFSREVLSDISKDSSVVHRVRALKELGEVVLTKELEEHAIEALLNAVDDLLDVSAQTEGRQAALQFLVLMTESQYDRIGILRSQLFRILIEHTVEEDLALRVSLLKVLTHNGKDIEYCEQIGAFLVEFMSEALYSSNADEFLSLLVNMVHYNSSFLGATIISALVCKTCQFCDQIDSDHDIEGCLSLLDASVRYGGLPSEGIFPLIGTLCRTVNIEKFCQPSWKLMRSLVGTKLGHTAIYFMCQILEDNRNLMNTTLLRGAVFFIGMSIWGSKRVTSLHYNPVHVLPSFRICLQSANALVAKEVSLSLQRLVKKFGEDQEIITWDVIMDILEILLKLVECSNSPERNSLATIVHSLLTSMEQLYTNNKFHGCTQRLFRILAICARDRPEESVSTLLAYYQEKVDPMNDNWLEVFQMVLSEYLHKETRTAIRVNVIHMVTSIFSLYRHKYEDDILMLILNDHLKDISMEKDREVRLVTSQLLSDMLHKCSASNYPSVLQVIETLISLIETCTEEERENIQDIEIAIDALIKAFREKLFVTNNNYVVNIFTILFNHVNQHYIHGFTGTTAGVIRKRIFTLLLSVRANERHYIGLMDVEERVKYSAHAIFKPLQHEESSECMKVRLVYCDFQKAFDAVLKCLKNELDWIVLECVLKHLQWQLQNKSLFVYCQCNMNKLCSALCVLVNDKMYLNKVQNTPPSMGISELRNLIFPILSVIATYHLYMARDRQFELVNCIEFGLNTHCAHTCVSCLSVCILEMPHVMVRILPSVLVKLSQISATVQLAIPVLEFLSTLKEIPMLYHNFVEEQYMSIFAMALSYTDSYRYTSYIVTLAHQIIADWFTRCRLPYRKGFVTLIAKALKSTSIINADREKNDGITDSESNNEIKLFHEEMTNVCLDMMARYSFSSRIKSPIRSNIMEYLLSDGTSQTWLVGNMLITITTCSSIPGHCSSCCLEKDNEAHTPVTKNMDILEIAGHRSTVEMKIDEKSFCSYEYIESEESKVEVVEATHSGYCDSKNNNAHDEGKDSKITEKNDILPMDDGDRSCSVERHDRRDSAALVTKLTEILAKPETDMAMFSPSESLLFSRQGSKSHALYDNTAEDEEEEEDYKSEEDDNQGYGDTHQYECDSNVEETSHCDCHKAMAERAPCECENALEDQNYENMLNTEDVIAGEHQDGSLKQDVGKCTLVESALADGAPCVTWESGVVEEEVPPHTSFPAQTKSSCKLSGGYDTCICTCIGWAEVYIRRATGNVSWLMEIDNKEEYTQSAFPDVSMCASSLDYLELYKNLSCYVMTEDKHEKSNLPRETFRRHSTGSYFTGMQLAVDSGFSSSKYMFDCNTLSDQSVISRLSGYLSKLCGTPSLDTFNVLKQGKHCKQNSTVPKQSKTFPEYFSREHTSEVQHRNFINPNFIFLQLFYSSFNIVENYPIALEQNEVIERGMKILDKIPSFNTHKFGVLYVSSSQGNSEADILSNQYGSTRYADFISGLGNVVNLTECNTVDVFTGGLDCRGKDGNFAYVWKDETTQVVFHVATLMPNKETDSQCVSKKMHIGNNFLTIIYDESKHGYAFGTIKGQFNSAEILIRPLEYNSNMVTVRYKEKTNGFVPQAKIISDCNLPILVRQLSIHTNMAVVTELREKKTTNAFVSNWLERLRQIKRIKSKTAADPSSKDNLCTYDFTKFT